jgi:hypothetical protein
MASSAINAKKAIWYEPQNSINLILENDAIAVHRILKGKIGIQSGE